MYIKILSSIGEFLPRRVRRAALLKAMLLHEGVESKSTTSKIFDAVGLTETNTSNWLAKEVVNDIHSLPDADTNEVSKWIDQLPEAVRYETRSLLLRDVVINSNLIHKLA